MAKVTIDYTEEEFTETVKDLIEENRELKRQIKQLKKALEDTVKYVQKKIYWEQFLNGEGVCVTLFLLFFTIAWGGGGLFLVKLGKLKGGVLYKIWKI